MEDLEILVQHSHRQVFDEILKDNNIFSNKRRECVN